MTSADIAIIAFIVFMIMLWRSLMPRAREKAKAMDEWHLNGRPYRWQDEIMPDDVPVFVKLASSWLLVSVAIPATGWGIYLAMYKSGWVERQDVAPLFWGLHLVCAVIVLIGFLAFQKLEALSGQTLRGVPFWKQILMIGKLENERKVLGVLTLAGDLALRFELGWVFIGGPVYFGVMK